MRSTWVISLTPHVLSLSTARNDFGKKILKTFQKVTTSLAMQTYPQISRWWTYFSIKEISFIVEVIKYRSLGRNIEGEYIMCC